MLVLQIQSRGLMTWDTFTQLDITANIDDIGDDDDEDDTEDMTDCLV